MYDASSSCSLRPRTPFARSVEEEDSKGHSRSVPMMKEGTHLYSSSSSSLVTRSSNNSSSSQQKTKPSSPKEREGAGQDYAAAKKRRRITLSTIQALRHCITYVTRVKTSLLASNHDAEFDAFLELLCNWSDQGLTSEEVFSQMAMCLLSCLLPLLHFFLGIP